MKKILYRIFAISILLSCGVCLSAQTTPEPYLTIDDMPDLVQCLPAPPAPGSAEFALDVQRYEWGKKQRLDPEQAAIAEHDAYWDFDSLAVIFSEPFGMEISPKSTPQIYQLLTRGVATLQLIRVRPKKHFMRQRPFEYFNEHVMNLWEEDDVRGEGSYPSGHTIRGWGAALILSEINPAAANALYHKGWEYGVSRVIVGAHWQSDVDASRPATSIAYSLLQTSPAYRKQVARAKKEFKRLTKRK